MNAEHTTRLRDTVRKMLNVSVYLFAVAFGVTASVGLILCILAMVINGFDRTNMHWQPIGFTPGAPNVPWSNLPPAGTASGTMMCWDVEAVYTNGEAQLGSYSSKGGSSLNRCVLDAANPAFAGTITTGGILSLRLYAAGPVAAAYRSMNYTTDPGVRPALYLDGAVPEPAGAGMLVLALMLALRRTNSRMQAGLYPDRERKPGMPADARIALE